MMLMPRLILASIVVTTVVAVEQANDAGHVRAVPQLQDVKDHPTMATIKPSGEVRVEHSEMPRKQRAVKSGHHTLGDVKTTSALRTDADMVSGYDNAVEIQEPSRGLDTRATTVVDSSAVAKPEPETLGWKDGLVAGILAHFQVQDGVTRVILNVCIVVWSLMLIVWFCAWKIVGTSPSEVPEKFPENQKPSFAKLGCSGFGEGEDELDAVLRKVREAKRVGKVPEPWPKDSDSKNLSDKLRGQRAMLFEKIWADAKKDPAASPEEVETADSDAPQDQPQASKEPSAMEKMFQQMDARLKAENEELREKIQITN
eukprot:gnl/MRDRNA2_/MRDRNA2_28911_c0_seq1.p1 gnl/MRDRNA2_/MRDRNA2_28911_c0~~gnl/MRDRNA2_/MRDRNA2_28911_c0_seq1.p1  ORF type:complete len:314 (-),score=70.95 gnl/MRDRNA2_/MRDRNA2_28911_c0_seq1:3-944(-)